MNNHFERKSARIFRETERCGQFSNERSGASVETARKAGEIEAIVFIILQIFFFHDTQDFKNLGNITRIFLSFCWGIFSHVTPTAPSPAPNNCAYYATLFTKSHVTTATNSTLGALHAVSTIVLKNIWTMKTPPWRNTFQCQNEVHKGIEIKTIVLENDPQIYDCSKRFTYETSNLPSTPERNVANSRIFYSINYFKISRDSLYFDACSLDYIIRFYLYLYIICLMHSTPTFFRLLLYICI